MRATSVRLLAAATILGGLVAGLGAMAIGSRSSFFNRAASAVGNCSPRQGDWVPWEPPKVRAAPLRFPVQRRNCVDIRADDIQPLVDRLKPRHPAPLSALLHVAQLYGLESCIPVGERTLPILEVLTTETAYFQGRRIYTETPTGLRCLTQESAYRHVQPERQTHACQLLCEFAKQGVPRDQPIVVNGVKYSIGDGIADLCANISLESEEVEWGCIALICYLPPTNHWKDKNQHVVTFDQMAECLMRQPTGSRRVHGCFGIHRLEALVMLSLADESNPLLSSDVRAQVHSHLAATVKRLLASQALDGAWDAWAHLPDDHRSRRRAEDRDPNAASEMAGRALIASHHVSWMLLLKPEMQPANEVYGRAAQFLVNAVTSAADAEILQYYCPYSHAAKVLVDLTSG